MSSLEKTENQKLDSLKGMVIKQYLDNEDKGFDSGTDSFGVYKLGKITMLEM